MDWRGRAREREVKLHDWRGGTREREVRLQLFGVTRNPYHGLAWSNARTRGKVATCRHDAQPLPWIGVVEFANARKSCNSFELFGVTRNPYHGLAWSSARTRGKVATLPRLAQPLPWIGVVERRNAR